MNTQTIMNKRPIIHETTNYELFAKHELSRDISKGNFNALLESLSEKSLLDTEIVQVTPNRGEYPHLTAPYLVTNGNHRLEAAKQLGETLYYVIDDDFEPLDMARQFHASAKWNLLEILKFWIKLNKEEYVRFKNFADDFNLEIKIALPLVRKPTNRAHNRRSFVKGTFVFPNEVDLRKKIEKAHEFLDLGQKKFIFTKRSHMRVPFYDGFFRLMDMKDFDWSYFIKKHEDIGCALTKHIDSSSYFTQLQNFYFFDKKRPKDKK